MSRLLTRSLDEGATLTDDVIAASLPLWDLTPFFPSIESPEFDKTFNEAIEHIDALVALFDEHGIGAGRSERNSAPVVPVFEATIDSLNTFIDRLETLGSYLYATISVDTREEAPQVKLSELEQRLVAISKLSARLTAWLGSIDADALIRDSETARDHAYLIRRGQVEATHLMSPAEESLAAELRTSGGNAWARLYENVASRVEAELTIDGESHAISMPALRLLAHEPDRARRQAAFTAELAAWEAHETPIAAALNAIKGESITLSRRRSWDSPLDLALFNNAIDREILDAMMSAARDFFPDASAYFGAKAKLLGLNRLAWFDLFAPIPHEPAESWPYERALAVIEETFDSYSPRLGDMARRAFSEQWIDARPRPGKTDGAYCIAVRRDTSRVFMNYTPSYAGISTLAHELGHAYHNVAIGHRPGTQRRSPSTLAETASIFCETLLRHAAIAHAEPREELAILEGTLQDATHPIVDIASRFLFEQRLFERRADSDVPVSELKSLMLAAQKETYGDGLAADALHPYMWAVKGHYYSVEESFYNFPYMFGLLFGLGLYQRFRVQPEGFAERYDDLLSSTGRADAAELAGRFGLDLRSTGFWQSSLDIVRADIQRYVELADLV
ncbi:MAG: M3 family oligoendopeptidase [Thermomicrobiales bacterium]|nr:M3 family oligoendopeptidase [Thermomicrobiales bacterium]